jgi:hypothetical protein
MMITQISQTQMRTDMRIFCIIHESAQSKNLHNLRSFFCLPLSLRNP